MLGGIFKIVDTEEWEFFLKWLAEEKDFDRFEIIEANCYPHKYQKQYEEYLEYKKESDNG